MTGVEFTDLSRADLVLEQTYRGGSSGNAGDDPLAALLPVGNQGGFRYAGSPAQSTVRVVVLYASGSSEDWPDALDAVGGTFTYYGDNRRPGRELHDTPRRGNLILRKAFADAQAGPAGRAAVPPFLLFERDPAAGRAVRFRGLLAPGSPTAPADEHLVALWRSRGGERFQNYRALFTVLEAGTVPRAWLDGLTDPAAGPASDHPAVPEAWKQWVRGGGYTPLLAPATTQHRSRAAQEPATAADRAMLLALWSHFRDRPTDFEPCAGELFRLNAPSVDSLEITRASRDGGRDATGHYAIGPDADRVRLEFALEAKCYRPGNAVGTREAARLISRLKHRQFGVLITTSHLHEQAYREVREDGHPVVVLAGADLVRLLRQAGLGSLESLNEWLNVTYPPMT